MWRILVLFVGFNWREDAQIESVNSNPSSKTCHKHPKKEQRDGSTVDAAKRTIKSIENESTIHKTKQVYCVWILNHWFLKKRWAEDVKCWDNSFRRTLFRWDKTNDYDTWFLANTSISRTNPVQCRTIDWWFSQFSLDFVCTGIWSFLSLISGVCGLSELS